MAGLIGVPDLRSPFTVERPPPTQAPHGCPVIIGWELAAYLWPQRVAEQFMTDSPHGGDLDALKVTFVSATQETREAVAQYRVWLIKQQGG